MATAGTAFRNAYAVPVGLGVSIIFGTDGDSPMLSDPVAGAEQLEIRHGFVFPLAEHARRLQQIVANGEILSCALNQPILSDEHPPELLPLPESAYSHAKRNNPCPCGSGKKFKKCHGAASNRFHEIE